MRLLFKVIIVFLIIFNWRVPYVYNSVSIAIILLVIYYIYNKGAISLKFFFQRYNATILIATIILGVIIFAIAVFHGTNVLSNLEKRVWVQFMMLFAIVFSIPLLVEGEEEFAFEKISVIICYAFALQGLIHLTGFLFTPIGDFLFEMQPEVYKDAVMDPARNLDRFRLYALSGSVFFELPAAYGVACILFFRLLLIKDQKFISGWIQFAVLFFFIAGISLSGRTGFVGLGIGVFLWLLFSYQKLIDFVFKNGLKILLSVIFVIFAFNYLLSSSQRRAFTDELFPFAFEAYYNWRDVGRISTYSTDVNLSEKFYYYLRDETLFAGHGLERTNLTEVGYTTTDAGYMLSIIFGGIPFLICLMIYQSLYFIKPLQIANRGDTEYDRKDLWCLLLLFIYMFILHFKESAMGTLHIVETLLIVIGSSYLIRYYYRDSQEEKLK